MASGEITVALAWMNSGRERIERRLAAVLMAADQEYALVALKAIRRELAYLKTAEHRGGIIKTTGNEFPVKFSSGALCRGAAARAQ